MKTERNMPIIIKDIMESNYEWQYKLYNIGDLFKKNLITYINVSQSR